MTSNLLKKIRASLFRIIKLINYSTYILVNKEFKLRQYIWTLKTFLKGVNLGDQNIPWIPFTLKIWLDKILKPDMTIYEFGSGLSTIYLSTKVKTIISVEHEKEWFDLTNNELKKKGIINCEYHLIEPETLYEESLNNINNKHRSNLVKFSNFHFKKYIESIDSYPDKYFDLIFIDGRARIGCILQSLEKIKSGGFLVLDDSNEKKYKITEKLLKKYERRDFYGITLLNPYIYSSKISFGKATYWEII
jgi:precorrin-6B methylase 2